MQRFLTLLTLAVVMGQVHAHAPYVAPHQFIVEGGNTSIVAGFAEAPFDSEVAIRGFEFSSFNPAGEQKPLTLTNIHSLSVTNLEIPQEGTYQILGQRDEKLKYAQLDGRWLRVLDPKGATLAPLAERTFIAETELKESTPQVTVTRFDDLLSYLTKKKLSDLKPISNANLQVTYSNHPNLLKKNQPVDLSVAIKGKPAVGFSVKLEKNITELDEKEWSAEYTTDTKGQVKLNFPKAGRYIVTLLSPQVDEAIKPTEDIYRTVISLNVAE